MKTRLLYLTLRILLASPPSICSGADLLDNWTWRNPLPNGNVLNAVAWGEDRYVAVGGYGTVLTSPDGTLWTPQQAGLNSTLFGVAYHAGLFVAVGLNGRIITSPDGVKWTPRPSGTTSILFGVVWGNDRFVTVGVGTVASSPDGLVWNRVSIGVNPSSVAYGDGLYVAVGPQGSIRTSTDGVAWTARTSGVSTFLLDVAFGDGVFVAVGNDGVGSIPILLRSTNGIAWNNALSTTVPLGNIAYGNGRFVVGAEAQCLVSPDGLTWTQAASPFGGLQVGFADTQFLGFGPFGEIATSPDGVSWTTRSQAATYRNLRDIVFENGSFMAVGNAIVTSADGQVWTEQNSGVAAPSLNRITYGQGLFVSVGDAGRILTSPDGAHWARPTSGTTFNLSDIAIGEGQFVAVGNNALHTQRAFLTSPNGTNWTVRLEAGSPILALAGGQGRFVAVGDGGAIRSSADGVDWVLRTSGTTETLREVVFGDNQFVAVGDHGTVVTSPDGVTWTRRLSTGQSTDALTAIAFGSGLFVASVGPAGTPSTPLLVSADGVHWTRRAQYNYLGAYGISYGNGQFITVGNVGAILGCDVRPRLGQASVLADGAMQVALLGVSGLRYSLEASTNLTDWSAVTNVLVSNGTAFFTDSPATNSRQRFYRTSQPRADGGDE